MSKIIIIAGPTAAGKTSLAGVVCKMLPSEIVCMDSMQIYKGADIGTATPTAEEMLIAPHHLFSFVDIHERFSAADYKKCAEKAIDGILSRNKTPILCGGTGLYLDSVLSVGSFSEGGGRNEAIRTRLMRDAEENGALFLHEKLAAVDPESADKIHPNNIRRVVRALEIYYETGVTKTEWDKRSKTASKCDSVIIIVDFSDRSLLYDRIDRRVDMMLENGLEKEARAFWEAGLFSLDTTLCQAIGYKEFAPYFEGRAALCDAISAIKQNTRRYAKRQQTWFSRYNDAVRIFMDTDSKEDIEYKLSRCLL